MHLNDIHTMFEYNSWANNRLVGVVEQLTPEQYTKNLDTSHGGVHSTLAHIVGAEEVWLKRWRGESVTGIRKAEEFSSLAALHNHWKMVTMETLGFCHTLKTDNDLQQIVTYKDMKGNEYRQPLYLLMQHLINHSTFHRGQVVAMLRQLGIQPVGTDMIIYFREIAQQQ